jgi:predicted GH43/DUF377 family glycosyl hydrolase
MVEADGTWVMLYNGNPEPGLPPFGTGIGRATAPDPTGPWQRDPQPILVTGETGSWDANFVFPSSLLKVDDEYVLYYSANGGGRGRTGRATSADGITWEKYPDPVLETGESDEWDFTVAWGAGVKLTDNGWEMTYTGGTSIGGPFQGKVGYATSEDGINWTKYTANPVVEIEDHSTLFTSLEILEGTYYVYYGLTSTDGAAFTEAHLSTGTVSFDQ